MDDLYSAMYGPGDDDEDTPREQPLQLRLAGKATVVRLGDQQVAIPKIEYVEIIEQRLIAAERMIEELSDLLRKADKKINRVNIAKTAMPIVRDRPRN